MPAWARRVVRVVSDRYAKGFKPLVKLGGNIWIDAFSGQSQTPVCLNERHCKSYGLFFFVATGEPEEMGADLVDPLSFGGGGAQWELDYFTCCGGSSGRFCCYCHVDQYSTIG